MKDNNFEVAGEYRYALSSTGVSSAKYGNCEVCGKHCTEIFYQVEQHHYAFDHDGKHYEGWTEDKCNSLFGHSDCLKSIRHRTEAIA